MGVLPLYNGYRPLDTSPCDDASIEAAAGDIRLCNDDLCTEMHEQKDYQIDRTTNVLQVYNVVTSTFIAVCEILYKTEFVSANGKFTLDIAGGSAPHGPWAQTGITF